jgi:putative addiction module component (TIGR02574 family)
MSSTSVYLAEEALALPLEQRETLAKLLTESLVRDARSDDEIKAMLRTRLEDLKSGRDEGMSFEEVFGEKLA